MRTPLLVALVVSGCGSSSVSLQFQNLQASTSQGLHGTQQQGLNDRSPEVFKMKLVAVYLAEDVDPVTSNNIGISQMIYLNPACAEDIAHCELAPGKAPDDGLPYSHFVEDSFDFHGTTAAVNAAINAQHRAILAGTYRYARMEFCKGNEARIPTVTWGIDGQTHEFFSGSCGMSSKEFATPLVVTGAESILVTLGYDFATSVSDVGPDGRVTGQDCITTSAGQSCFTPPTFVPSASRAQ